MRDLDTVRRQLQDLSKKPSGVYRGRLAEDYDGIGQYISVALAGSSTSSGYKSRIAAGDFGGGRTFPRGTPVTVFAYRGNLEVMLGNLPRELGCVVFNQDNFGRIVAQGETLGQSEFTGNPLWTDAIPASTQGGASVDGSSAFGSHVSIFGVNGYSNNCDINTILPLQITSKFRLHNAAGNTNIQMRWFIMNPAFTVDLFVAVNSIQTVGASTSISIGEFIDGVETSVLLTTTEYVVPLDTWVNMRGDWGTSNALRLRLWLDSEAEPDTWQLAMAANPDVIAALEAPNLIRHSAQATNPNNTSTSEVDFIKLCAFATPPPPVEFETVCDIDTFSSFWEWTDGVGDGANPGGTGWAIGSDGTLSLTSAADADQQDAVGFQLDSASPFYDFVHGGSFTITVQFTLDIETTDGDTAEVSVSMLVTGGAIVFTLRDSNWLAVFDDVSDTDSPVLHPAGTYTVVIAVTSTGATFTVNGNLYASLSDTVDLSTINTLRIALNDRGSFRPSAFTAKVMEVVREDGTTPPWCEEVPV